MITLKDVWEAKTNIKGKIHKTHTILSFGLSEKIGSKIYLKTENMQKTGSFKVRGAFNNVLSLSEEKRAKGLVSFSSGNHSQAVAFVARALKIPATVVMPEWAVSSKIEATKAYGAKVVLYGKTSEDIYEKAIELMRKEDKELVHPYDNLKTIAGQGTLGLEVLEALPDADTIFVPIGGGGLISGVALAMKSISPSIRVIGVEPEGSCSMLVSRQEGKITALKECNSIADGLLVKEPGYNNFNLVEKYVDELITVSDVEIGRIVPYLLQRTKMLVEPSGVVALSGLLSGKVKLGKRNVAVLSGGNCDPTFLKELFSVNSKQSPLFLVGDKQ